VVYSPRTGRWELLGIRREGGIEEMPRVARELRRDMEELETHLAEEAAPQERTEEGMEFPFLVPVRGEEVILITEISTESNLFSIREHLLNRPFYARNIHAMANGRVEATCRCMTRREQVVAGERGPFAHLRSFLVSNVVVQRFPISESARLYQEYLRRVTPGYRELPADFDFSIKPDDESKIKKREIKEGLPRFGGWWSPGKAVVKYRNCLFLAEETRPEEGSGRIVTKLFLVDYKGIPMEGMGLMQFYGDIGDEKGYVALWNSISSECPFRTESQQRYELSLERE
jgi:hypothetical protein